MTKAEQFELLKMFVSPSQLTAMVIGSKGEESEYFFEKFAEYAERIKNMPKSYETDGQGDDAIVYLHYFIGGMDWYITEKDMGSPDDDEPGQYQAFGFANLGFGGELGYISIAELIANGVELDLHWTPKTLREVKNA